MKSLRRMIRFVDAYRRVAIIGLFAVILPVAIELVGPSFDAPIYR